MKIQKLRLITMSLCMVLGWSVQSSFAQVDDTSNRKVKVQHTRLLPNTFLKNAASAYSSDLKPLVKSDPLENASSNKKITRLPKGSVRVAFADDNMVPKPIPNVVTKDAVKKDAVKKDAVIEDAITEGGAWEEYNEDCSGEAFGGLFNRGRGYFFAGVEYLNVRPHFSEPTAYTNVTDPGTFVNGQRHIINEAVPFRYDYESNFRVYAGYRLCDCCAEFTLSYTRLSGNDHQTARVNGNTTPVFFELNPAPNTNEFLDTNSNVHGNIADAAISRCIELGDECQSCDSCPRWDLKWKAGIRFADMGHDRIGQIVNATNPKSWDAKVNFRGAGPLIGLEGRRYFGSCGQFSLYSNWELALLLGQYDNELNTRTTVNQNTTITTWKTSLTRTIPMTGIELGTSWQPNDCWTLSAGWLLQVWWDLGMTDDFPDDGHIRDDSNIMSWDGFTFRAERAF